MPFAPVDDAHTEFFYQDSGVPILKDRPYTTLVAVHGYGWNSCEDLATLMSSNSPPPVTEVPRCRYV
jgi:hypothetical protein